MEEGVDFGLWFQSVRQGEEAWWQEQGAECSHAQPSNERQRDSLESHPPQPSGVLPPEVYTSNLPKPPQTTTTQEQWVQIWELWGTFLFQTTTNELSQKPLIVFMNHRFIK